MYPLIIFTDLLGSNCNYSMSVGAITNGFVDDTQHDHGIKYFSFLFIAGEIQKTYTWYVLWDHFSKPQLRQEFCKQWLYFVDCNTLVYDI